MKVFGDPLETLWKNCILGLCGVKLLRKIIVMVDSTAWKRRNTLRQVFLD